ncbi:unnamed protein product [Nezara viridula]|uniref:Lipase n=1 Tax=Nezara viridula TaxID=85310 RepID=A0A9P0E787_NEZVI|nr:unnamed protein product [Nezara viridula]
MDNLRILMMALFSGLTCTKAGRFDPSKVGPLPRPPPNFMNASQLITYHGYEAETYNVHTEDGYILPLYRIANKPGPPVLLMMGLGLGPELWVLRGSGHDLGFILSDLGYDVWLGSMRGNHKTSNIRYNTSQPEFWDFSHDEIGYYDLPAMIDQILKKSTYSKLYYAGASLGSTIYMVLCSERPEYQAMFSGSVHFGPAMWIPQWDMFTLGTKIYLSFLEFALGILKVFGVLTVSNGSPSFDAWLKDFCNSPISGIFCYWGLDMIAGFNRNNMEPNWGGYTLGETASGSSIRSVQHLIQLTRKGGTQKYNWGPNVNFEKYGSYEPPSYSLSKIMSPTAIYYSKIDKLIPYEATKITLSNIGNIRHAMAVPDPTYGHVEFIYGKNLYKLLFSNVVDFLDSLSGVDSSPSMHGSK